MAALLYLPHMAPRLVAASELTPLGIAWPEAHQVAALLDCAPGLVDVLAREAHCTAFSIFDYEGPMNEGAMRALTGTSFDRDDEDEVLCGPVLALTK